MSTSSKNYLRVAGEARAICPDRGAEKVGQKIYHDGGKKMKLDLTSVKKNPLFNRQEIEFKIEQATTPSRSNVRVGIAVALKSELNQVYVREIKTQRGTHLTIGTAHVYDDPGQALKVEPKHIIERNQKAQPEPEPEAPEEVE
jgi:ribosomal protein S24E